MAITSAIGEDGCLTINVAGRFDFSLHQEFRDAYEKVEPAPPAIRVDMGSAEYLDSSALGMLLLLRERAGGDRSDIAIVNCSPAINKILTISNFHKLFKVS